MFFTAGGLFFPIPSLNQPSPLSQVMQKSWCMLAGASIHHSVNPKKKPNVHDCSDGENRNWANLEGTPLSQLSITISSTAINVHMGAYRTTETLAARRQHAIPWLTGLPWQLETENRDLVLIT